MTGEYRKPSENEIGIMEMDSGNQGTFHIFSSLKQASEYIAENDETVDADDVMKALEQDNMYTDDNFTEWYACDGLPYTIDHTKGEVNEDEQ